MRPWDFLEQIVLQGWGSRSAIRIQKFWSQNIFLCQTKPLASNPSQKVCFQEGSGKEVGRREPMLLWRNRSLGGQLCRNSRHQMVVLSIGRWDLVEPSRKASWWERGEKPRKEERKEEKKGGEKALKSSKALSKYKTLGCGLEELMSLKWPYYPRPSGP